MPKNSAREWEINSNAIRRKNLHFSLVHLDWICYYHCPMDKGGPLPPSSFLPIYLRLKSIWVPSDKWDRQVNKYFSNPWNRFNHETKPAVLSEQKQNIKTSVKTLMSIHVSQDACSFQTLKPAPNVTHKSKLPKFHIWIYFLRLFH